ncbi:MAG: glycine cleavage system protein H [Nanobdellota archaeon]
MNLPENLKYNKDNSWVKFDGETATVGVAEPATKKVEFVFIQLPEKGKITKGDTYVSLEGIKWSGHLASPVTGTVTEVNEQLFDEPSKINEDPYGQWIMKVTLADPNEVEELMDSDQAKKEYGE